MRQIINHFTDNDLYTFTCMYYVLQKYPRAETEYSFFDRNRTCYPKGFDALLREQLEHLAEVTITDEEREYMTSAFPFLPYWFINVFLRGFRFNSAELTITQDEEGLDKMVREHPHLTVVAAHPGEAATYERHLARMKLSENYYLDLSGSGGPLRFASTRNAIDKVGVERLLFGSDYPTCQAGIMIGSILMDYTLTDTEKEYIFSKNAKRLLKLD